MSDFTGWDHTPWRPNPGLASRRCWLAVPVYEAPHVLCRGCGERFETLTEFERHVREQEMAEAIEADIAAEHRRRARARSEAAA